jgi:carboxyl-terminal processing protease
MMTAPENGASDKNITSAKHVACEEIIMQSKTVRTILIVLAAFVVVTGAFSGGIITGYVLPKPASATGLTDVNQPTLTADPQQPNTTPKPTIPPAPTSDLKKLFEPFWQTWTIVHDQFVDQPVNDLELMRGAIRGMLDSLGDQHTSYMDPDQYRQANTPLVGEYEGIGAWVDITGEFLTITAPIPNTPAEKAGLKTGDVVIAVDAEDMTGVDGNIVLKHILGPAGTQVTLTIQRPGMDSPFDVTITRAKITIPSVESKMLENNIAYVRLNTYGEKTTADLRAALTELLAGKPRGLILDLRNNGGGYLQTAIEVVSEFLPGGQVAMYEEMGDKSRQTFTTKDGGLAIDIPLVVLVNEGTASASEITAGAIQDYGRGKLVGIKTYGKGSVQNWVPLDNEAGAVRVTIARWLTPKERQIHKVGLTPDVVVEITDADIAAGKDPQLDKAISILSGGQ